MGDSFGHLLVEPRAGADTDRIEAHLQDSPLDVQWTTRVDGNVVVVGYGVLERNEARAHLVEIVESLDRGLHLNYHDPGLYAEGFLYAADGADLTEVDRYEPNEQLSTVPVTDYFKREHDVDGPR